MKRVYSAIGVLNAPMTFEPMPNSVIQIRFPLSALEKARRSRSRSPPPFPCTQRASSSRKSKRLKYDSAYSLGDAFVHALMDSGSTNFLSQTSLRTQW